MQETYEYNVTVKSVEEIDVIKKDDTLRLDEIEELRQHTVSFHKKRRAIHSATSKFCIGLIAFIVTFYPSTYTFIKPPYDADFVIVAAVILGAICLVTSFITIFIADYSSESDRTSESSEASKLFASLSLSAAFFSSLLILFYTAYNLNSDIEAAPIVQNISIQPLNPKADDTIMITATSFQQRPDILSWKWNIKKIEESTSPLQSATTKTGTHYWRGERGTYSLSVCAYKSENENKFDCSESITLNVR